MRESRERKSEREKQTAKRIGVLGTWVEQRRAGLGRSGSLGRRMIDLHGGEATDMIVNYFYQGM